MTCCRCLKPCLKDWNTKELSESVLNKSLLYCSQVHWALVSYCRRRMDIYFSLSSTPSQPIMIKIKWTIFIPFFVIFPNRLGRSSKARYIFFETFEGGLSFVLFSSSLVNVPILCPQKTPENLRFSVVFRGFKMRTLVRNGLIFNFVLDPTHLPVDVYF